MSHRHRWRGSVIPPVAAAVRWNDPSHLQSRTPQVSDRPIISGADDGVGGDRPPCAPSVSGRRAGGIYHNSGSHRGGAPMHRSGVEGDGLNQLIPAKPMSGASTARALVFVSPGEVIAVCRTWIARPPNARKHKTDPSGLPFPLRGASAFLLARVGRRSPRSASATTPPEEKTHAEHR